MLNKLNTVPKIPIDVNELLAKFSIQAVNIPNANLTDWLAANGILNEYDEHLLAKVAALLINNNVNDWFEEDLKMKAISLIMFLADIDEVNKIGVFYERSLNWKTDTFSIAVVSDCMVASVRGRGGAGVPHFFLQEFKKSKGDKSDPEAQMLAAMIIAQHQNNNSKVIYGAYVMGRNWYFSVLESNEYRISEALDMTNAPTLRRIVFILRQVKQLILTTLM